MQIQFQAVFEKHSRTGERSDLDQQTSRWLQVSGSSQFQSAVDLFGLYTGQIDGCSAAGSAVFGLIAVNLHAADSNLALVGQQFQNVSRVNFATESRSGNDRSMPRNGKHTIDWHPARGHGSTCALGLRCG